MTNYISSVLFTCSLLSWIMPFRIYSLSAYDPIISFRMTRLVLVLSHREMFNFYVITSAVLVGPSLFVRLY